MTRGVAAQPAAPARSPSPPPAAAPAVQAISDPDKVKFALQECRLLVLGVQILLGFAYRSFFSEVYGSLSGAQKWLLAAALACLLASITMLMAPTMYHRIAYEGDDDPPVYAFANRLVAAALLPFAAAIGLDLYVLVGHVAGRAGGIAFATAFTGLAIALWYGLEILVRKPKSWMRMMGTQHPKPESPSLKQRIEQLMTETRIILPGVQALLGFQLFAMLSRSFETLPQADKDVHVLGLGALALSMILLMAPAAYHRIVTGGEATEDVLTFSHYALLGSMVPLAVGLGAGFYVALTRVTGGPFWPAVAAVVSVLVMLAMWFALPLIARRRPASGR